MWSYTLQPWSKYFLNAPVLNNNFVFDNEMADFPSFSIHY